MKKKLLFLFVLLFTAINLFAYEYNWGEYHASFRGSDGETYVNFHLSTRGEDFGRSTATRLMEDYDHTNRPVSILYYQDIYSEPYPQSWDAGPNVGHWYDAYCWNMFTNDCYQIHLYNRNNVRIEQITDEAEEFMRNAIWPGVDEDGLQVLGCFERDNKPMLNNYHRNGIAELKSNRSGRYYNLRLADPSRTIQLTLEADYLEDLEEKGYTLIREFLGYSSPIINGLEHDIEVNPADYLPRPSMNPSEDLWRNVAADRTLLQDFFVYNRLEASVIQVTVKSLSEDELYANGPHPAEAARDLAVGYAWRRRPENYNYITVSRAYPRRADRPPLPGLPGPELPAARNVFASAEPGSINVRWETVHLADAYRISWWDTESDPATDAPQRTGFILPGNQRLVEYTLEDIYDRGIYTYKVSAYIRNINGYSETDLKTVRSQSYFPNLSTANIRITPGEGSLSFSIPPVENASEYHVVVSDSRSMDGKVAEKTLTVTAGQNATGSITNLSGNTTYYAAVKCRARDEDNSIVAESDNYTAWVSATTRNLPLKNYEVSLDIFTSRYKRAVNKVFQVKARGADAAGEAAIEEAEELNGAATYYKVVVRSVKVYVPSIRLQTTPSTSSGSGLSTGNSFIRKF